MGILDFLIAMLIGGELTIAAAATDNLKALCEKGLKGKYEPATVQWPNYVEQCPGGRWSNILLIWKDEPKQ